VLSSASCEVNPYDFRLPERVVTLECTQLEALMVLENVQKDLNKEWTVIVESNNYLRGGDLNVSFRYR
jgi:hypothetical protein